MNRTYKIRSEGHLLLLPKAELLFKFQPLCAEVQKQTFIKSCGDEIIDELDLVDLRNQLRHFQFNNQRFVYQHVCCKRTNDLPIVIDADWPLRFSFDSAFPQFPDQRILVNRLEKSHPKSRVHFHRRTNDPAAEIVGLSFLFHSDNFVHSVRNHLRHANHQSQVKEEQGCGEEQAVD